MKKLAAAVGGVLLCLALAGPARAGVFNDADILKPGHFSLGLEPEITFSPSEFEFWLHGGLGLVRNIGLEMNLGMGDQTIFGADVRFGLIPDTKKSIGLTFSAGAHGSSNLGLDATLLLSNWFRTFNLFCALDAKAEFVHSGPDADNHNDHTDVLIPLYFDLGVVIPIARQTEFLLEGNIGLTNAAASSLSGGVRFYL